MSALLSIFTFALVIFSFVIIFWTIKGLIYPNKFKLNWFAKQLPLSRGAVFLRGLGLWLFTLFVLGFVAQSASQQSMEQKKDVTNIKDDKNQTHTLTKEELAKAEAYKKSEEQRKALKEEQEAKEKDEEDEKACSNDITAFVMSQDFVRKNLKAPSTADFPSIASDGVQVHYLGNCTHEILAYVDADNSFGAKLRTKYYIKIQSKKGTDDEWRVLKLKMEE